MGSINTIICESKSSTNIRFQTRDFKSTASTVIKEAELIKLKS